MALCNRSGRDVRATFTRVSPSAFAEKVGIPLGWCVISHRWMPEKKDRRHAHGKWFRLSSAEGTVYRVLRFSANLQGSPGAEGQLVIDYPGWLDLLGRTENTNVSVPIKITPVRWWHAGILAVSHPDPSVRLAGWLAVLSFGLGIVSVVLGIWSICLSLCW